MTRVDVTEKMGFGLNDDECLPVTECLCGAIFLLWEFLLSIYEDTASACPECSRRFFFQNNIKIFEVLSDD